MKTVYLSSTFEDLEEHRAAVYGALRKARYDVKSMEDYVARDALTVDACVGDVEGVDLYILLVARRYGYVPEDGNPERRSITHLEYLKAREGTTPVLVFLLEPNAPWEDGFTDAETGDNEGGGRITAFRTELEKLAAGRFREPADLAETVLASVHLEEASARLRALPREIGSASSLTMVASAVPEIIHKITRAITDADKPEVFHVDLGDGDRWWSTRLLLLAGLCADYTRVQLFVFEGLGGRFLGTCIPSDVRKALAGINPDVETAYRQSLPAAGEEAPDPVVDVDIIVNEFSKQMDQLGGEPDVKLWIPANVVERWPGLDASAIEVEDSSPSPALLRQIIDRDTPFVTLLVDNHVAKVVNRAKLATQVALAWLPGIEDR